MSDVTFEPLPFRYRTVTPRIFTCRGDGWLARVDTSLWPLSARHPAAAPQ